MLINITLSLFNQFNLGNKTTEVTKSQSQNVFVFSRPANLIFPYCVSLLVSLAVLILGSISLHRNGFAAQNDSFVQLLVTLTRSTTIARYTDAESFTGDHDVPQQLNDLRIQFGGLINSRFKDETGTVRRAGFGVPEEIVAL